MERTNEYFIGKLIEIFLKFQNIKSLLILWIPNSLYLTLINYTMKNQKTINKFFQKLVKKTL